MVIVKFRRTKTHHIVIQASDGSHGSYQKQTTTWIYLMQTNMGKIRHESRCLISPNQHCLMFDVNLICVNPCHVDTHVKTLKLGAFNHQNETELNHSCVSHCTCWMALAMLQNHHDQPWLPTEAVAAYSVIGPGAWTWAHKKRKLASMSASSKPMTKLKASKLLAW